MWDTCVVPRGNSRLLLSGCGFEPGHWSYDAGSQHLKYGENCLRGTQAAMELVPCDVNDVHQRFRFSEVMNA